MWRVTYQVHLPTLALGVLWIIHSLATTLYVPWQNHRQRASLETVLSTMSTALQLEDRFSAELALATNSSPEELQHTFPPEILKDIGILSQRLTDPPSQMVISRIQDATHLWDHDARQTVDPVTLGSLINDTHELIRRQQQLLLEIVDQRSRTDVAVMIVRAILLVLGLMVGIGLAMWMVRGLQRSISRISVTLRGAEGELATDLGQIDVVSQGPSQELTTLETQVQGVLRKIRGVGSELQQTRRDMVRAERLAAVGQLAAGVAHEIRNPLTSVKLLLQCAAKRHPVHSLNDDQMQVVLEEVSRIENTVQGLLDFARPEPARKTPCAVSEIVARALTLLEGRLQGQQVAVTVTPSPEAIVRCDPGLIQQVLVNLVLNALDSMASSGRLSIRMSTQPADAMAVVEIEDSGTGIDPEVMQRLFEPFVTTRPQGSGLGLAISRRIVEDHGGALTAANSPTGGAVFTLRLPLAGTAAAATI